MRPWGAAFTGGLQSFLYMSFCLALRKMHFDDALENFPIYCTSAFLSAIASIFFYPDKGILWGNSGSGNALGI